MHDRNRATRPTSRPPHATLTVSPAPLPIPELKVVANFDVNGSFWGYDTITRTDAFIADAHANNHRVDEWAIVDRTGQPLRVVRTTDPTSDFLGGIDIAVIPIPSSALDTSKARRHDGLSPQAVAA